jgi:hypothetical protein
VGHRFIAHNRFVFRHRFPFRNRFAFAVGVPFFAGDSCWIVRRAWSPWGWRWRSVWVCG